MNSYILNILKLKNSKLYIRNGGFTLLELIIAAGLTSICIALAGSAVFFVTQNNKIAKSETERRVELNRSLDFIADEIRQANPIATNASTNLSTIAPGFDSTGKTPVLTLQIPGVSQRVIYYVAAKPSGSAWFGPNILYRWGPSLGSNGQYTNATNNPVTGATPNNNPANWQAKPLVDSLLNTAPTSLPACSTLSADAVQPCLDSGTLKCKSGTLNPPSPTGFYTCIDAKGQVASLYFQGNVSDAYGRALAPYEVSSQVFARPGESSFTVNTGSCNSGCNGGTVTTTRSSTAYFEILGGGLQCLGAPGDPVIPTTTTINITPPGGTTTSTTISSSLQALNFPTLTTGTTVTVTGTSITTAGCSGTVFNSQTNNGTQVLTLRNGDTPPLFAPAGSQPPIDAFLTKYLDAGTGKVKLASNQVIFLFELGTTTSGIPTYDMQDLVVLATIMPNEE